MFSWIWHCYRVLLSIMNSIQYKYWSLNSFLFYLTIYINCNIFPLISPLLSAIFSPVNPLSSVCLLSFLIAIVFSQITEEYLSLLSLKLSALVFPPIPYCQSLRPISSFLILIYHIFYHICYQSRASGTMDSKLSQTGLAILVN